jgi:hypothetical protein
VRQLQSDHKAIIGTGRLNVFVPQNSSQLTELFFRVRGSNKLVRVRSSGMADGNSLSTPH